MRGSYLAAFLIYATLGAAVLIAFPDLLSYGSDGSQYVNIAVRYTQGHVSSAINAYWGPLVSWLMLPFTLLGMDAYLAFKLQRYLTGFALLALLLTGLRWLRLPAGARRTANVSAPLFPLAWMLHETPDLLYATLSLGALLLFLREDYPRRPLLALAFGLLGALLYFCKAFGFPFFLSNLLALHLLRAWMEPDARRALSRQAALGLLAFGLCVAPWLLALDQQYGEPMVSSAGRYNKLMLGPENTPPELIADGFILPQFSGSLAAPKDSLALSAWEEPYLSLEIPDWRVEDHPRQVLSNLWRNVKALAYDDMLRRQGVLFVLFAGIFLVRRPRLGPKRRLMAAALLLTTANSVGGYLLILVQDRYLWNVEAMGWMLLLLLAAASRHDETHTRNAFYPASETGKSGSGLASALSVPLICLVIGGTLLLSSVRELSDSGNRNREEFRLGRSWSGATGQRFQGRWAALARNRPGQYRRMCILSHYAEQPFYGILAPEMAVAEMRAQLDRHAIDWLFVFDPFPAPEALGRRLEQSEAYPEAGITVYKILPDGP